MPVETLGGELSRKPDTQAHAVGGADRAGQGGAGRLIAVLLAGAFVMVLSETVMGVALPPIMDEFGVTAARGQWLTTAYMLVMAALIPMTGFILQRFSPRMVFIAALTLFCVGTAAAALAPGFSVLLGARVVQAVGTAVIMPLLTTTILNSVAAERRGRVMSLVAIVTAVAPALGPTFSGALIAASGWRSVFWVILPVTVLVLVVGAWLVKPETTVGATRFDPLSAILSVFAFGGVVYGLGSMGESVNGAQAIPPVIPLAIGAVAMAAFIHRQLVLRREDRAFLDLHAFTFRPFWVGASLLTVTMCAMFGVFILLPLYMQNVMHHTALTTGLIMLPGGLLMGIGAPLIGALYDRFGVRPLVIPGVFMISAGMALFALMEPDTSLVYLLIGSTVLDIGIAFVMTPVMSAALGSLPAALYSHGSAIIGTLQQLAGAAGTAIFVAIMSIVSQAARVQGVADGAAQAQGLHAAFITAAVVSLLAVVLAFLMPRRKAPLS